MLIRFQNVELNGAVVVTTPQDIALIDARKGINMFKKVRWFLFNRPRRCFDSSVFAIPLVHQLCEGERSCVGNYPKHVIFHMQQMQCEASHFWKVRHLCYTWRNLSHNTWGIEMERTKQQKTWDWK